MKQSQMANAGRMPMHDPYLNYILAHQPKDLDQALVLFDEISKGTDKSSPHVVTWEWLKYHLCWNERRSKLASLLHNFLSEVRCYGITPEFLLLGGSFLSNRDNPKDIDFLLVYRASDAFRSEEFSRFVMNKRVGLDYRAIPSDTGSLSLIKISIFYHTLFEGKGGDRGSLLIPI